MVRFWDWRDGKFEADTLELETERTQLVGNCAWSARSRVESNMRLKSGERDRSKRKWHRQRSWSQYVFHFLSAITVIPWIPESVHQ